MDLWATKDRHEREEDEAERLVREAPKKKPPRRDRRREHMDTERDPDTQTESDPDMSLNYKGVGGSVAFRWMLAKGDKIPAKNRDGEVVIISPETLKEKPGEYEELDPEEAAKAKAKGKKKKKNKGKKKKKPETAPEGDKAEAAPEEDKPEADKPKADKPKAKKPKPEPTEAEKAGIPTPPRRKASDREMAEAAQLMVETLPPEMAKNLISQGLHPDDVGELVANYSAAKAAPVKDLGTYAENAKTFFQTDLSKVPPPKTGKNALGATVPFDKLEPDAQAEAYRKYQTQVVAMSMAVQDKLSYELTMPDYQNRPRVPKAAAEKMAQAMLGKAKPPKRFVVEGGDIVSFDQLTPEAQALAEKKGEVEDYTSLPPEAQTEMMATLDAKRVSELSAEAHEAGLSSGEHQAIPDRVAKQLIKSLGSAAGSVAKGYLQANDYHEAKAKFLGSEHDDPDALLKSLNKASDWFKKRAKVYGETEHSVASAYQDKVLGKLRGLDEKKYQRVRTGIDKQDAGTFDKAQGAWEKRKKGFEKKLEKWKTSPRPGDRPTFDEDPPVKPIRYSLGRKSDKLKAEGSALMDDLMSRTASHRVARRYVSTYACSFAMDQNSDSPERRAVRQAVYHGVDPAEHSSDPYPGWAQPSQARIEEADLESILAAAQEWLKTPLLSRPVPGLIRDQQLRAALDLALKTSGYDNHIQARHYNTVLARLAGVSESETLLTQQDKTAKAVDYLRKQAAELAESDFEQAYDLLELADKLAEDAPASVPDYWMDRQAVAEVCPACADKMAELNIRKLKATVLFGSLVQPKTAGKGDKFKNLPKGWTDDSLKKMWASLTSGSPKHKVTACIKKMDGKVSDPGAFCAAAKDRIEGTTAWRGEREARYDDLRNLVIRTAASDAKTRRTLMPILQALKAMETHSGETPST